MQIEIVRNINGTNFQLHNLTNFSFERFHNKYFPADLETGKRKNIYGVRWCPIKTWHAIQEEMVKVGLLEEFKGEHKK